MFVDSVVVEAAAGGGGHGMIAFRREKHVPKGGPSGGNGGKGGDVVVVCDPQMDTLLDLRYRKHYRAPRGAHGSGSDKSGRSGADVEIRVPQGTFIYDDGTGALLADMTSPDMRCVVCRGGGGGRGNASFATPLIRAPREAEDGRPGEVRKLRFELKVMADVGLVGRPNAGKSTLLSTVSAARPKVAEYPFTTLEPHLGIVRAGDYESFVLADIPGLIEGAHAGRGLGHKFLRHIQRARVLVYLIEITEPDPHAVLTELKDELGRFDPGLLERPALVALAKIDLCADLDLRLEKSAHFDSPPLLLSAVSGEGVAAWIRTVYERHRQARAVEEAANAAAAGDEL
jgi:GTP-binding protein